MDFIDEKYKASNKTGETILRKTMGTPKKHVEQLEVIRYTHELPGEAEQYNQLLAKPITSSDEEEVPDIRFDESDLQSSVTQPPQEQSQLTRSAKSRNVRGRHGGTSSDVGKGGG